jgi:prevent-host-death family protein
VVGPAHWSDRLCATVLHMQQVGVRELRHNLSAWLRRVRDGEAFEVTDRGTPVAVLAPLPSETDPVALLESRGQIARRGDGTRFSLPPLRSPLSTEEILAELREDKV